MILPTPLPEHGDEDEGDEDRGEGELDVDDAHDQGLDTAADIGGDEAEGATDDERKDRAGGTDAEAGAQPVEDRRQHVAALIVGAEPIDAAGRGALARRQAAVEQVERGQIVRVLRRDQRREDRDQQDQREDEQPGHGDTRFGEIEEQAAQRRLDRRRLGECDRGIEGGHGWIVVPQRSSPLGERKGPIAERWEGEGESQRS